jgi:hypothetical protein
MGEKMKYETKEKINNTLRNITLFIDKTRILLFFKFLVFFTLIYTATILYQIRNVYLANDIIMMAAIFLILNRIDR